MKLFELQNKLDEVNLKIFTVLELSELLQSSYEATQQIAKRYTKKGYLIRLKRGLYMRSDQQPTHYMIANRLYQPSYISLESALSYYSIIPEAVYTITSVSPKRYKELEVEGVLYTYTSLKKAVFTGYSLQTIFDYNVLIASREKASVDFLYLVYLGRRVFNDRMDLKDVDFKKLVNESRLFKKKGFTRFIKYDLKKKLA